jgi:hypothetical protein
MWLSYLGPMGDNVAEDPGEFVLNVAFTGDPARHQAQLRPLWGGRLCVTRQQRTYRELLRIQRQLQGSTGKELGLRVLGTSIDEYTNAVDLQVVVLEERERAALEARYGGGAVQATAALAGDEVGRRRSFLRPLPPDLVGVRHLRLQGAGEGVGRIGQRCQPQLPQRLPVGSLRPPDLHATSLPSSAIPVGVQS